MHSIIVNPRISKCMKKVLLRVVTILKNKKCGKNNK